MSLKKKFVYTDTKPTNVCWNGVSFPVMPGQVIRCYPEFIEAFIDETKYREVPKGSKIDKDRPVTHDFGKSPTFFRTDPTGGLPMRSEPGPRKTKQVVDPMLKDDTPENPYELPEEGKTLEIGTGLDAPTTPQPKGDDITTAPPSERVEGEGEDLEDVVQDEDLIPADNLESDPELETGDETEGEESETEDETPEIEDEEDETEEEDDEEAAEPVSYPTKTQLRGLKVDELKALFSQYELELPENPTKGPMLEALFAAFYPEE